MTKNLSTPPDHRSVNAKKRPKIVAVLGQTGSGKTDLALKLAKRFNGEIIVADSRQIYKGLDIGVNKTKGEYKKHKGKNIFLVKDIPYHGLDLIAPSGTFTALRWKNFALKTIDEIIKRHRLPIIEGGTYLYVSTLLDNLTIPEVSANQKLRRQLEKRIKKEGLESLIREITAKDPKTLTFLDVKNPRRVIRALEIIKTTGENFSKLRQKAPAPFNDLRLAIKIAPEKLNNKIEKRVEKQIAEGLKEEVYKLYKKYGFKPHAMTGIGYMEWKDYFESKASKQKVIENIKLHNKQYARGQLKWLKRDEKIIWINSAPQAIKKVKEFLKKD